MRFPLRTWVGVYVLGALISALGPAVLSHLPTAVAIRVEDSSHRVVKQRLTTYGETVRDVLQESSIVVGPYDRLTPAAGARLAPRMVIEIRRAFPVLVQTDGHRRVIMTAAATVDELIGDTAHGLAVRPHDRVYPSAETPLVAGDVVRIVRIDMRIIETPESIPYARIMRPDMALPSGVTRVAQPGRPGVRTHRLAITTSDGVVIDRRNLASVITLPPQDHVVHVGMRRMFADRGEFAGKEVVQMEATAYAPWHGEGVNDITAIGLKARYGVVAVDPTVIPLRSVLFIEGYGRAVAGDTGGAIKGYRIDLCYDTVREAYQFGRRPVRVYIISTPPSRRRS
ncbi:MAG TPA: 3D domain-containing protein [bacterium]|nr:3D domain-containing protein [bacterium]